MKHYFTDSSDTKSGDRQFKLLCTGAWAIHAGITSSPTVVNCPGCLTKLIDLQERRLTVLKDNLAKLITQTGSVHDH